MKTIAALFFTFFLVSCAQSSLNPLKAVMDIYQGPLNHCSAVRSGDCPMHPSCSDYSKEALEKYGFFIGAMLAFDRLMRCGRDELGLSPVIYVEGRLKCYDPLEQNTSWWDKKKAPQTPQMLTDH
ncbi:MAG: membrane protein insertion efficiency factor YidD [Deltaproteobacteria bacterium]|nr:membrane protein insertion efficiency factor YidD [Deltaproteobacteria bacterium]